VKAVALMKTKKSPKPKQKVRSMSNVKFVKTKLLLILDASTNRKKVKEGN
jgi:hypothetical protein